MGTDPAPAGNEGAPVSGSSGLPPPSAPPPPPPPPPSGFLQGLLDAFPAGLLVVDGAGVVRYAAGQLDRLGWGSYAQLVGNRLSDSVDPGHRADAESLVAHAIAMPSGGLVGPVPLALSDLKGSSRRSQAWAVNKAGDPNVGGVILVLLPETSYDLFDEVLVSISGRRPIDQLLASLVDGLRRPPAAVECFFAMPGGDDRGIVRSPRDDGLPGPPSAGPWDDVFAGAPSAEHNDLSRLAPELRELAREANLQAVSCLAVHPGPDGRPDACLVVWDRHEGPLVSYARRAVERAALIASLAMSHGAELTELRDDELRDPLTGLGNRRAFFQALEQQVDAGRRPAVLCVDLDGFREVNERLGQLAGDAVLRVVARRLYSVMRPTDELARLGGDEFAVLCEGSPTSDQMVMIAERVLEQLSRPLTVGDGEAVDIGASVGIALGLPMGTPAETILGRADHALSEAKEKGQRQWALVSG